MPYEYRRLTADERAAVLEERRARGYPLHSPPHPFRQAGYYLVTAANFEHAPLMADPQRAGEFEQRILAELLTAGADISGWVVLPNHYHLLVCVEDLIQVSNALKHLHGTTSREWNHVDGCSGRRRVWYRYTDRVIRDERHYHRALNYVHVNPLKHRYVDKAEEWPWSSLHIYLEGPGRDWLRQLWRKYPPGDFGKGWDD